MTKAALVFEKRAPKFLELPSTKEYIEALRESLGSDAQKSDVYVSKAGWHLNKDVGVWAHPKLAVFFARWLDVRFAVWCDAVIEDLLKGKAELVITKPKESAVMSLPQDYAGAL